jgi:chaperone required for assembly of F1-ATPase
MKRFYDEVAVQTAGNDGWQVTLDRRGIKTVKGTPQIVPTQALARELASEWIAQGEELDASLFPKRDAVDYAIDVIAPDPAELASNLVDYGDTDTLLYRADPEDALYVRQQEVWEPIVKGFEAREGITLTRVSGIMHRPQDEATIAHLRGRLSALNPFVLAGVEVMSNLAASLTIGLCASETDEIDEAISLWAAACLEEEWQSDLWGRDHEEDNRRAKRKADFLSAHAVTRLALRP